MENRKVSKSVLNRLPDYLDYLKSLPEDPNAHISATALATALGFALSLIVFAGLREQLSLVRVPKGVEGMPIALVVAGLLALAFMGFSGIDKGIAMFFN